MHGARPESREKDDLHPRRALSACGCARSQVCLSNKAVLSFFDRRRVKRLNFVNIRDADYTPAEHNGISFEDAMAHFHVIDGSIVTEGSEAVLVAYSKVGLGWVTRVMRFPLIRWFVDILYSLVSKHRYTISKFLPGGKQLGARTPPPRTGIAPNLGGRASFERSIQRLICPLLTLYALARVVLAQRRP